ncbi:hypothetical protein CORC01_08509, partial [Colletotrichum orchidophilum]
SELGPHYYSKRCTLNRPFENQKEKSRSGYSAPPMLIRLLY